MLPPASRTMGVLMLVIAAALWSLSGPMVKLVGELPPIGFSMWRSVGAAMGVGVFLLLRQGVPRLRTTAAAPPAGAMLAAAVLFTANVTLLIFAMREGTAARGILLQYTGPAWVALISWLLLGRRIGPRTGLALGLAGAGVLIMLAGTSGNVIGSVYGVSSGLSYGGLILALDWLDRRATRERGAPADPAQIVLWLNVVAVIALFPIALVTGRSGFGLGYFTIVFTIVFGVVQLAIPYALFQLGLRRVGPVDAALIVLLEPVLNPIWTWLAVGEEPDVATFIGGALLLGALVVEATKKRQPRQAA